MIFFNRIHYSHLKTHNVTVSAPKPPPAKNTNTQGFVLKVDQLIDLGNGQKILTVKQLEGITAHSPARSIPHKPQRFIPRSLDNLTLITTQKSQNDIVCIQSTLNYYYDASQLEKIVPDVLMPNDLLVIEYGQRGKISLQALRVVKQEKQGINQNQYALPSSDSAG